MPKTAAHSAEFAKTGDEFLDGLARICRLYGVSPLLGRLWGTLFLAPEPLALEVLAERVHAAKSTVSVALRKLESTRVIRRTAPRGDRRDYYEVVADPWVVLADWRRIYLEPELAMWRASAAALDRALRGAKDAPRGSDRRALRDRVAALRDFGEIVAGLIGEASGARPAARPARTIAIDLEDEP
jgi:DNA-binding transcriptional regulator GbsR (MarR family)